MESSAELRDTDGDPEEASDIEEEPAPSNVAVVQKIELTAADFYFGITLGEGAYARVIHAKSKKTSTQFAVKIMDKVHIKKENKIKYVMMERHILTTVSHPFVIKFHFSFQDPGYLYMCMDFAPGGDLLGLITKNLTAKQQQGLVDECCDLNTTQFYTAEIVEAVEYLHSMQILHRDLKPENILLDANGHIKITDFGTSSMGVDDSSSSRNSFVGTQDYVSPEVLSGEKAATKACDLWAIGCIIYQMISGRSPFRAATEYLTFELIMGHCKGIRPIEFPSVFTAATQDIVLGFLRVNDTERLGAGEDSSENGYPSLKRHDFFDGILWNELVSQQAPYQPDSSKFPSTDNMRDGALDEWDLEGDPTPIDNNHHHHVDIKKKNRQTSITAPATQQSSPVSRAQSQRMNSIRLNAPSATTSTELFDADDRSSVKWKRFLYENEKQVFTGLIYKRKGMFSKKRQLILTDRPRLFYVDPDSMSFKGEIPWTFDFPVECAIKNAKEFDVRCSKSGRAYHLLDSEAGSQIWVDLINAMLERQQGTRQTSNDT